jgi:flavin reductase (DIM6/NTAB) family NADH-FMN oxidoreductase RutF
MSNFFLQSSDIEQLEKRVRAHLVNSVGGFKSVVLVGTKNQAGNTNVAIFSSVLHIGAHPPLIALIFRPSPPQRDTLRNLLDSGFYTLNHLNESMYRKAHQTSARYEADESEFDAVGLTPEFKNGFQAPFVRESNVQLGLAFREKIDLTINNTTMVIGEITQLYLPKDCWKEDGFVDIEKANTITCSGLDSYHTTTRLDRLRYAKPDQEVATLPDWDKNEDNRSPVIL